MGILIYPHQYIDIKGGIIMKCSYAYYDDETKPQARIYCKITNTMCMYSRFCVNANKYLPKDKEMESCVLIMENKRDKIPSGSHYVRFIRKGYLYIETENGVIKVKNELGREDIEYVYLRKIGDKYEVSTLPFEYKVVETDVIEKPKKIQKRNYKRK